MRVDARLALYRYWMSCVSHIEIEGVEAWIRVEIDDPGKDDWVGEAEGSFPTFVPPSGVLNVVLHDDEVCNCGRDNQVATAMIIMTKATQGQRDGLRFNGRSAFH